MPQAILGAAVSAIGSKAGEAIGGLFQGDKQSGEASAAKRRGQLFEGKYTGAEAATQPLLEAPETDPVYNQLTQDTISKAVDMANRQLGVGQSQQGVSGGQALLQKARQSGDISKDLQWQDAMKRRQELLEARGAKRGYLMEKEKAFRQGSYGV